MIPNHGAQDGASTSGTRSPPTVPEITVFGVKAPEWCKHTVYRWNQLAKLKVAYTVTTKFAEVCGTKAAGPNDKTLVANGRWERAPFQMLTKCAEAAALREAFPEEIGLDADRGRNRGSLT